MDKCKYFDTVDRAICTCDSCVNKCGYFKPTARGQLLALNYSRKVIDQLFSDSLITAEDDIVLNIIWYAAEKAIRSELECLE